MALLRGVCLLWITVCPITAVNLYRVRNSGIYFPVLALSVLLAVIALHVLRRPSALPWRSRLTVPLLALAAAAVAAGVQGAVFYDQNVPGQHRYLLVQIYAVALVLLSIGAAFGVAVLCRRPGDVLWMRRALIAAAVAILLSEIFRFGLGQTSDPWVPRGVTGWWPLVNAHAITLILAAVLFEPIRRSAMLAGLIVVAISLIEVVLVPFFGTTRTQWLSGWIATGVPVALIILARFPRQALLALAPAMVALLVWQYPRVERVYIIAAREGDLLRLILWEDAVRIASMRPFLGVGPGNYLDYVMRYGNLTIRLSSPHGNYQQIAAEMGVVGLGFALWLFWRALRLGWRLFRATVDPRLRSISIAATCSLAGTLAAAFVGDFAIPNYHNGGYYQITTTIYAWLMIGLLMSLERLEASRRAGVEP